jgi:two-component system sensor kinase FixL
VRRGERVASSETTRRRKDGVEIDVSLTVSPIRDLDGKIVGASKTARDITQRKRAEKRFKELHSELLHVSRLSTMGQMASTMAHELNQPLTAVTSYLQALRRLIAAPGTDAARVEDVIDKAVAQAARAGQVIRRLREFVAKGETERRLEDVNEMVEEAVTLALVGARQQGVAVTMQLGRDIAPALVDKVQIQQVILNLVRNAVEAMEESDRRELLVSTRTPPGGHGTEIRIADTGPGLSPAIAARLFQPFQTTKRTGMGLGLSICREIIEAHHGRIAAAPNAPRGTVFTVALPEAPEEEANAA